MIKQIANRLRYWSHWRCEEPIVIFESDDWGMKRRSCSEVVKKFGLPGEWSNESLETKREDLERLFQVLEKYKDPSGRSACFTANFIVANPDSAKIKEDNFLNYHDLSINSLSDLKDKWVDGFKRRVFLPQYHGRSHFWPEAWLDDLRSDVPGAKSLLEENCYGGLSLIKGQGWRYHSEYLDWRTGKELTDNDLFEWINTGLSYFRDVFKFLSLSTIAPHYIFSSKTEKIWGQLGIRYIQGTGYRILRDKDGKQKVISHYLGERSRQGMLYLVRNVKFDPRPERPKHHWQPASQQIRNLFKAGIPAIIDTHRINYIGKYREESLRQLDSLLRSIQPYKPIFLTSVELGEAIEGAGVFKDVFSLKQRTVSLRRSAIQSLSRLSCNFVNNFFS